jgi:hypothetical protein
MAKIPAKVFSKMGAAPTPKTPATAVTSKMPAAVMPKMPLGAAAPKVAAKAPKPGVGRLSNLGDFAHPAKGKKKS